MTHACRIRLPKYMIEKALALAPGKNLTHCVRLAIDIATDRQDQANEEEAYRRIMDQLHRDHEL